MRFQRVMAAFWAFNFIIWGGDAAALSWDYGTGDRGAKTACVVASLSFALFVYFALSALTPRERRG